MPSPASPSNEKPTWGSTSLLPRPQGSIRCKSRTEKYLRSLALNTSEPQQRPWEAQSGGNPPPKELRIKRVPLQKRGSCSQYELQLMATSRWDTAPDRQGHRRETLATSAPGPGAQPGRGHTEIPLPSALSPRRQQPGSVPKTVMAFQHQEAAPKGCKGQGWLQPRSPLHPQRLTGGSSNPPALRMKPCLGSAPSWSSHRLLQAGEDPPRGKYHRQRLSQPRPRRRGQCRTCSSSYFSQNLLVKGRQVRYSTQRQFTG